MTAAPPPPTADSGAIRIMGLDLQGDRKVPRKQVFSWALWDWATQPFNSVILTFVFTALYLTSDSFLSPAVAALPEGDPAKDAGLADLASGLGWAVTIAGILIAILAPVLGQRADVTGRRKLWLGGSTLLLVLSMFGLFFVQADPAYFVLGVGLIAAGSVFSEIAGVNYNAMLVQVSTPKTVGKVSGLGWGLGYIGGIVALVLVVVATAFDWWGMPTDDGLAYRVIAVGCAVWAIVFAWPIFAFVPEAPPAAHREKVPFFKSYVVLFRDIVGLWKNSRPTFWFLLASAVFRDGLAGVFTFGAVLAAVAFRFTSNEVLIFGIAANLVAGLSTILAGLFDDRFGARAVIITALTGLVVAALAVFFLHDFGKPVFWVFGLILCLFVGPAQAASRSFLARVTPAGKESEIFGLYATTGRAASFLSPLLWAAFIGIAGATYWGILGIVIVLAAGLVLMLFVKVPAANEPAKATSSAAAE
ncbi:MFS transporter [Agromyces protaetiae]|uniref:MFS transporter n=1 Tax=Agromyces protaetiae TaxID=2509455 RepID=A0A4P6F993_9MICO|nr:MFS transporter [Agromyces protaetiae]QAY72720.1 MFS transporter [Agromyces protaetiae]